MGPEVPSLCPASPYPEPFLVQSGPCQGLRSRELLGGVPLGWGACGPPQPPSGRLRPVPWGSCELQECEGRARLTWALPRQRPTAKELLKHKFITRYTKKTSFLTELIDRYKRWKSEGHGEESSSEDSDM